MGGGGEEESDFEGTLDPSLEGDRKKWDGNEEGKTGACNPLIITFLGAKQEQRWAPKGKTVSTTVKRKDGGI